MRLLLLLIAGAAAKPDGYSGTTAPSKQSEFIKLVMEGPAHKCVSNSCSAKQTCEVRQCRCEVCIPKTCEDFECKSNEVCDYTPDGPACRPKKCKELNCKPNELCDDTLQGGKCRPKTCNDITCEYTKVCKISDEEPKCRPKKCKELTCEPNELCDDTQEGGKCRPKTCDDITCEPYTKCNIIDDAPICRPISCADIRCSAGEICNDLLDDGPDCVPDVPTCEGYFCRRGTNCYIRTGSPLCLPNTCEVRECDPSLKCIDTRHGALCRKGKLSGTCQGKYCPPNTECRMKSEEPTCAHI